MMQKIKNIAYFCKPCFIKISVNKRKNTCLEKYGGHPNQNKEVQAKSEATSYHYKTYI